MSMTMTAPTSPTASTASTVATGPRVAVSRPKLDQILHAARELGATDIHLVRGVAPAFRVNGEIRLAKLEPLDSAARAGERKVASKPGVGLNLHDDRCDAFHIYWDPERKTFDWWRL